MLWFGRRAKLDQSKVLLEVRSSFCRLSDRFPAATYIFARTLENAKPLLASQASVVSKQQAVLHELRTQGAFAVRVDGGMSALALRCLVAFLAVGMAQPLVAGLFREFTQKAAFYRRLDARDDVSPSDADVACSLARGGYANVRALVEAGLLEERVADERRSLNAQTLLAAFDVRAEASDDLCSHMQALDVAISRLLGQGSAQQADTRRPVVFAAS